MYFSVSLQLNIIMNYGVYDTCVLHKICGATDTYICIVRHLKRNSTSDFDNIYK